MNAARDTTTAISQGLYLGFQMSWSSVSAAELIEVYALPSLGNLPRINQGRQVEADDIHLQFDSIVVLNHSADNSILDFAVMQVHADPVA